MMFSRCFPLALLRVLFGWADLAIASHFHSRGGCGGALSARAAPKESFAHRTFHFSPLTFTFEKATSHPE
jgi:hypothetical protein